MQPLINLLRLNITVPLANTLRRTIHDYAQTIHLQLKDIITRNVPVHAVRDTLTSTNGLAFAGMSVHVLDDNCNLKEEAIGFQSLEGSSHTGKFLSEKLTEIVCIFDLAQQMLCLVTDNAESNYVPARAL